ncbi:MAG: potassium channel family protein [Methanoculleaceae archaeon]
MYIIIVGLGGIGRSLVSLCTQKRDNVVVIDQDESRCTELLEHYDILTITGNATDKAVLEDAGIERADALVATTSDDAVNLMTCWLAKRYNVPNVVSIVNQPEHSDFFDEIGVVISENPDELVASRLYFWVKNPGMQQLAKIPGGLIFQIVVDKDAPFVHHRIRDIDVKDFVFIAIHRANGELIIPSGSVFIEEGDTIWVFTREENEKKTIDLLKKRLMRSKVS